MDYVLVFLGGGLGASARLAINSCLTRWLGGDLPYGTLFINISGSLIMGLVVAALAFRSGGGEVMQSWRLFLTTGILGGYTTFSAFSLEAVLLYERGALGLAALYVGASVVLAITGLISGLYLVRQFS